MKYALPKCNNLLHVCFVACSGGSFVSDRRMLVLTSAAFTPMQVRQRSGVRSLPHVIM